MDRGALQWREITSVGRWYEIGTGVGPMAAASFQHQGICKLISERPEVLLELIPTEPGQTVPDHVELLPGPETIREVRYPEHNVDTTVVLRKTAEGRLVEALVTEVQLRPDDEKPWSWPIHVAGTRARLGCPTTLVVITDDEPTARWAAQPIDLGRGRMVLQPIVIGPDRVPRDLDLEAVRRNPELATLAVMMHGTKPGSKRLNKTTLTVVKEGLDNGEKGYSLLLDLVTGALDDETLKELEGEMELQRSEEPIGWFARKHYFQGIADGEEKGLERGRQEGIQEGRQEGRQEGELKARLDTLRQAIVVVLTSRQLAPSLAQLDVVLRCTDAGQLESWLRRACEVTTPGQLFEAQRPASARRAGRSARGGPDARAAPASARRSR